MVDRQRHFSPARRDDESPAMEYAESDPGYAPTATFRIKVWRLIRDKFGLSCRWLSSTSDGTGGHVSVN